MLKILMLSTLLCFSSFASAGKSGTGGLPGDPHEIDAEMIRLLLEGDGLKNAMIHYLDTVDVDSIEDLAVRNTLSPLIRDGRMKKDILTPDNYKDIPGCRDFYDSDVAAAAMLGEEGGLICFDAEVLAKEYRNLSSEEVMIKLASLAIHEHEHHFQSNAKTPKENEKEAYHMAGYVQLTAKVVQIPLLKWEMPPPALMGIQVYNCEIGVNNFKSVQEAFLIPDLPSQFTLGGRFLNTLSVKIDSVSKDIFVNFDNRDFRGPLQSTKFKRDDDGEINCSPQTQSLDYVLKVVSTGELFSLNSKINRHQNTRSISVALLDDKNLCYMGSIETAFADIMKGEVNGRPVSGSYGEKNGAITVDYTGSVCAKFEPYYEGEHCVESIGVSRRATIGSCL